MTASGGDGRKEQVFPLSQQRQGQTETISPGHAVALVDANRATDVSRGVVTAILKAGGNTSTENSAVKVSQRLIKDSRKAALIFGHGNNLLLTARINMQGDQVLSLSSGLRKIFQKISPQYARYATKEIYCTAIEIKEFYSLAIRFNPCRTISSSGWSISRPFNATETS